MEANLCLIFMLKYVIYSLAIARSVVDDIAYADDVMASGYGWAPPISVIAAFGGVDKFTSVAVKRLDKNYLSKVDIVGALKKIPAAKYDYRPYFKAK
jgi:3-hydroxyacyl-CoA dehydrogenase